MFKKIKDSNVAKHIWIKQSNIMNIYCKNKCGI